MIKDYSELDVTINKKARYKFKLNKDISFYGSFDSFYISFYDNYDQCRGYITPLEITILEGYSWDGCSPKVYIPLMGWTGTPDFPSTRPASLLHDFLYQFLYTENFPFTKDLCDIYFLQVMKLGGYKLPNTFHGAVKDFGRLFLSGKVKNGEYSKLMNNDIYLQQVGLKALGFDPGPIDGLIGPKTRSARQAWEESLTSKTLSTGEVLQTSYKVSTYQSPNKNTGINTCEGVVLHHADGSFKGSIDWILKPGTNAAYHVLINMDGERAILGKDTDRLHHAGASSWKGKQSCNNFTLGVAYVGNTNTGTGRNGVKNLTKDEIASTLEWLHPRMKKYGWTKNDIAGHRIVSPGRKDDPSVAVINQIKNAL